MPLTEQDREFLQEAIDEAVHDPRIFKVGAVIAKGGVRLAKAHGGEGERKKHAELTAIDKCLADGKDLTGATLYTTLEPCTPDAREPDRDPCAVAILNQGFGRVVIGVLDPNHQVRRRGVNMLQGPHLDVVCCDDTGLQRQIRILSKAFFERSWARFHSFPGFALDSNFRGRWQERTALSEWVCRRGEYGALPIYVLWAMGGMGKSNLTWLWAKHDVAGGEVPVRLEEPAEIAAKCMVPEGWARPLRILWFSFYKHEGGKDFNTFLEEALIHFSAGTLVPKDFAVAERIDYGAIQEEVIRILGVQRCLMVWDGAERVLNEYSTADPSLRLERRLEEAQAEQTALRCRELRVSQFLWNVAAQSASKLLISSRLPFEDLENRAAATVELKGIDTTAGVTLLRAHGVAGPTSLLEQAVEEFEGHPLSLTNLTASLRNDFELTGDISGKRPADPGMPQDQRRRHIFALAFGRRAAHRRQLLSRMSRVRGRIGKEAIRLLAQDIPGLPREQLGREFSDLVRLGLVRVAEDGESYEFHPVTRRYIYEHPEFSDERRAIHDLLRRHYSSFSAAVDLAAVSEVAQLEPCIEEYYHAARSGRFLDAVLLFKDPEHRRLNDVLYHDLCDYGLFIELVQELFPEGLDRPPSVPPIVQGTFLNDLAHAYAKLGEAEVGMKLLRRAIESHTELLRTGGEARWIKVRANQEIGLGFEGLASHAIPLGLLQDVHESLKKAKKYYVKAKYQLGYAIVQQLSGKLCAYLGQFKRSGRLVQESIAYAKRHLGSDEQPHLDMVRGLCIDFTDLAFVEILASNFPKSRVYAEEARRFLATLQARRPARILTVEVEWVSGYSELDRDLESAGRHLDSASAECRRLRLVQMEPALLILRGMISVRRAEAKVDPSERTRWLREGEELTSEALRIAERCKYRLNEAEACNLLATIHLEAGDVPGARVYAERAKERAACDVGPAEPYYYKPAFDAAARLIDRLGR